MVDDGFRHRRTADRRLQHRHRRLRAHAAVGRLRAAHALGQRQDSRQQDGDRVSRGQAERRLRGAVVQATGRCRADLLYLNRDSFIQSSKTEKWSVCTLMLL